MAARLARRGRLTVWNRTAERAAAFARDNGAAAAGSPAELAAASDVVITCLPTSREVRAFLELASPSLRAGMLVVDCTSGDPAASRRTAAWLAERDVAFADAPVSGGTNGAAAGTLTVMVGGDRAAFLRAEPTLRAFGKTVEHLGPVGAGHAMKAVNNALLAVNILAVGEGVVALVKAGVAPAKALDVLNASSGRSFVSEVLVPERVLSGAWPKSFRLALLDKDVGIARAVLREAGVPAPIVERAAEVLSEARRSLGDDADYLEPIKLSERAGGAEIRA